MRKRLSYILFAFGALAPAFAEDRIVVTAERRATQADETPGSIAVLDAAEIERIGADHPSEALFRTPGTLIHRGNGQEQLTSIRSPILTGGAGAGSFLFLENGVPLRSAGFGNVNALFEAHTEIAQRIEVVRGPSGALYGANAIHGVVNVLTPAPSEAASAGFAVSGDTVRRIKGDAFASGASGAHAAHIAVSALSEHGFRADSGVDQQKMTLRHVYDGESVQADTVFSFVNLNQETAGFVVGPDAYLDPVLRRGNDNPEAFRDARAFRLSSALTVQPSDALTLRVTPFVRSTATDFLLHFVPSQALEENGHWSVGVQAAAYWDASSALTLIAGLDAEYTDGFLRETQSLPSFGTFPQGVHFDFDVAARSVSGFAQASAALAPRLTLRLAARADYTQYRYDNQTSEGAFGRFLRPPDRRDDFLTLSPKVNLLYETSGGAVYASYARGARPPQVQDLYRLQTLQTADPARAELIDAAEFGWRRQWGDYLYTDVALYWMDKRNFFFRDADGFNVNDGRTRHQGVEMETSLVLPLSLTFSANAAFARHTYRFDRPVASTAQRVEAIQFGDDVDSAPRILAGARLFYAPDHGALSAEAEWVHVGRYFADAANTLVYPGHDLLHLRVSRKLAGPLSVRVNIRNVLNAFYAERADIGFSEERYFPGEPRVVSVGLAGAI